jgi:hypothetical protein
MITLAAVSQENKKCCVYQVKRQVPLTGVREFVVSTPETRAICNDPFVLGVDYTDRMRHAGTLALEALRNLGVFKGTEHSTHVLTILRGGLNFQLREALSQAFGWNTHGSWFISAQRQLVNSVTGEWEIVEDSYNKMFEHSEVDVVFGDVVATGTSLQHGLDKLRERLSDSMRCRSVTFFTIGASVSGERIERWRAEVEHSVGQQIECSVVYYEGVFGVAQPATPIRIKIDGTDLLRRDGAIAPEFLASQAENAAFPIERCTIYDAGSRAFCVPEYLADVQEYWHQVLALAFEGVTFFDLVRERCPEVDPARFGEVDLGALARAQLQRAGA